MTGETVRTPGTQPEPKRIRCLIMDDSSFDRRLVRAAARGAAAEFDFSETTRIEGTHDRIHAERPDVCLFDLDLPDGDGLDLMRRLGRDPATARIPVIVLSRHADRDLAAAALAAGAAGVLAKRGLTPSVFERAINAALALAAPPPEVPAAALPVAAPASAPPSAALKPAEAPPAPAAARPAPLPERAPAPSAEPEPIAEPSDPHERALFRLGLLKSEVLQLLAQSWKLIDAGKGATDEARGRLSKLTRRTIARIDDMTVDAAIGDAPGPAETLNLVDVLREVAGSLADALRARHARVDAAHLPTVVGVRAQFRLLFEQLLLHALRFARLGLGPVVEFGGGKARDGSWTLWYRDSGVNLATRLQSDRRVFEAPDAADAGALPAGFGLSVCQRIVERAGGTLAIFGEEDGGCRVVMRFGRPKAPAAPRPGTAPLARPETRA